MRQPSLEMWDAEDEEAWYRLREDGVCFIIAVNRWEGT